MRHVESELDRYLLLLRQEIRRRGYTQLEIQRTLGWGRSYISQLLTKQKGLRVEHVLLILKAIGMEPAEFFGEIYEWPDAEEGTAVPPAEAHEQTEVMQRELREQQDQLRGLVDLLVDKGVIDGEELMAACRRAATDQPSTSAISFR